MASWWQKTLAAATGLAGLAGAAYYREPSGKAPTLMPGMNRRSFLGDLGEKEAWQTLPLNSLTKAVRTAMLGIAVPVANEGWVFPVPECVCPKVRANPHQSPSSS